LEAYQIDYSVPTLVYAECVLIYLTSQESDNIIKFFADNFENVYFMNYEMMKLNDPFGKVMIKNFEARGCQLSGIDTYPDAEAQKNRYLSLGYTNVEVYDMLVLYDKFLDQNERKRIEKVEWLDEIEEWQLISRHYYFSLSSKLNPKLQENHLKINNGQTEKSILPSIKPQLFKEPGSKINPNKQENEENKGV